MTLFKVEGEISNSVNDEVVQFVKYFRNEEDARAFEKSKEDEVERWNNQEIYPYGGRVSTRWLDIIVEEVSKDTELDGLTLGDLEAIIRSVVSDINTAMAVVP